MVLNCISFTGGRQQQNRMTAGRSAGRLTRLTDIHNRGMCVRESVIFSRREKHMSPFCVCCKLLSNRRVKHNTTDHSGPISAFDRVDTPPVKCRQTGVNCVNCGGLGVVA